MASYNAEGVGIETLEYIDVQAKALSLGCNTPTSITILPHNFVSASEKKELYYLPNVSEIRELFHENNIPETSLEQEGERTLTLLQESSETELVLPLIFVSYSLVSQNPHLVSVALNIISNYLTDWFKNIGNQMSQNVELSVVVQANDGICKEVKYKGPVSGLGKLEDVIRATSLERHKK